MSDDRTVEVIISGSMLSQQAIDQIVQAIREAVADGDVIIFDQKKRPQE